jgi:hypothetical protein
LEKSDATTFSDKDRVSVYSDSDSVEV